ncbi:MAG: T9SS type A sorting domain-containing protein [Bacteroidales bacterium]
MKWILFIQETSPPTLAHALTDRIETLMYLTVCSSTEVGETPTPAIYYANLNTIPIKVYPNPADKRIVNITFQNTGYHKDLNLECYNVHGKLVHSEKLYKYQGESKLNIQEWQSGMYIALVFSKGQILGKAKFLVR